MRQNHVTNLNLLQNLPGKDLSPTVFPIKINGIVHEYAP